MNFKYIFLAGLAMIEAKGKMFHGDASCTTSVIQFQSCRYEMKLWNPDSGENVSLSCASNGMSWTEMSCTSNSANSNYGNFGARIDKAWHDGNWMYMQVSIQDYIGDYGETNQYRAPCDVICSSPDGSHIGKSCTRICKGPDAWWAGA